MKILVIGGTGHVGSYLAPMLRDAGEEVWVASRGTAGRAPAPAGVQTVRCDSSDVQSLAALADMGFDTVIDLPGTAWNVWCALAGSVKHIIACGSLWMYGAPAVVPTPEALPPTADAALEAATGLRRIASPCPFEGYARRFEEIGAMLAASGRDGKALFTAIMPPNICGAGKIPLEPAGGRSAAVHAAMAAGQKTFVLPKGPRCLIGPCHASDIAQLFLLAAQDPAAAAGQIFNAGAAYALPMDKFVEAYARIYGTELPYFDFDWGRFVEHTDFDVGTWWHFYAHMAPDISRARSLLGYAPRYTPEEAMADAVDWMRREGLLTAK